MNTFVPSLKYLGALFVTNLKATLALRVAFWLQAGLMVVNNLVFFTIWPIFFNRYDSVNGWKLGHMAVLYGVSCTAFGVWVVVAGGVRDMAQLISDGDLDTYLTLPKNPLVRTVASRMQGSGWGDLITGIGLLSFSGVIGAWEVPLVILCVACASLIYTSTGIIAQSVAFWAGPIGSLARQFTEFLISFSVYPGSMFSGVVKVILFTIVPAGFISHLPLELIANKRWEMGAALVGATTVYCLLAIWVFSAGLRRYESGNRFGVQA
ncbi:MAG: ABC transporter permease [Planctomycetes bacterium]|nr:ABC transporter permease [Planctomycetota bacterium]NUQ33960.1 ABC-2 family transporter protein [Planctomycetaceae bacterium]